VLKKALAKKKLINFGVLTPKYKLVTSAYEKIKGLKYPLIIKPNKEHGSVGITEDSIVHDEVQLQKKLNEMIHQYGQMLVEEYIPGKEVSTLVIGDKVMRVSEIIFDEKTFEGRPKIMTYEAKWNEEGPECIGTIRKPAKLSKKLEEKIIEDSRKAYKALGCRGYARIDFRLDENGTPYVLEVNTNPDLSRGAAVSKIAEYSGISHPQLIMMILENAKQIAEQEKAPIEERKAA
jgi:D-alanine-D-alanine ligase